MAEEAIVLAGGRGTRLRGVVDDVPKPLAQVAGRPFLAWLLDALGEGGIRRVVLATGYLGDQIEQAIGRNWGGMEIAYSQEAQPLGTGGAIRQAASSLHGAAAHVVNGDTYLRYAPTALQTCARDRNTNVAMALAEVDDVARYGAVECSDGLVSRLCEKGGVGPGWINAGCYYLGHSAFDAIRRLPPAFSLETGFLEQQVQACAVAAFRETRDFIDIGTPDDFVRAQTVFRSAT